MQYSDVYYERKAGQCSKPEEWSYLDRQVLKSRDGYRCRGRCVRYDGRIAFDDWKQQGTKFNCDCVHAECWNANGEILYDNIPLDRRRETIHYQIVEKPLPPRVPSSKRYNIYVLMIDSSGFHQTRRNLPKSMYFFDRELQAVEYEYLNKLGLNSYPNVIPLWYGKAYIDIEKQMLMGQNKTPAVWESVCNDTKKAPNILAEAKNYGYQTFLSEFFMDTVLKEEHFPCVKYTKHFQADHDAVPLSNSQVYEKIRPTTKCERFKKGISEELDYFGQFINSYKDTPKFGWLYLIEGSHNLEAESMLEDTEIYDFLIRNKEELSNSFVFITADHGLRFGEKLNIDLGEYDNRNPVLAISLPKELRDGRLMANLRQNSKQLQTHYDTRSTMLDIMKYQPAVNFTAWQMEIVDGEKGNSYLREQPGPRTCHTLPIPFQYCLCEYKMEKVDSNSHLGKTLANYVLDSVNGKIIEADHASKCGMWQLKEAEIKGYFPIRESGTFEIMLNVRQDGIETGKLRAIVQINNGGKPAIISVARVDKLTYAWCAELKILEFCYCYTIPYVRNEISKFVNNMFEKD